MIKEQIEPKSKRVYRKYTTYLKAKTDLMEEFEDFPELQALAGATDNIKSIGPVREISIEDQRRMEAEQYGETLRGSGNEPEEPNEPLEDPNEPEPAGEKFKPIPKPFLQQPSKPIQKQRQKPTEVASICPDCGEEVPYGKYEEHLAGHQGKKKAGFWKRHFGVQ